MKWVSTDGSYTLKKSRKLQNLKILKQKITKIKFTVDIFFSKNYIILLYVNK